MSDKPSMLYASPFPPVKSGISDYSVCLVKALSALFDITLYSDNYDIEDLRLAGFPVLKHGVDLVDFNSFDYRVYNIGNQPEYHGYIYEAAVEHPGMIILHDYMLYYLFVGHHQDKNNLYSSLYSKIGYEEFKTIKEAVKKDPTDLLKQKDLAAKLPLNKELLLSDNKIMVHSEYSRNKVLETGYIEEDRIKKINHLALIDKDEKESPINKKTLFEKYKVPEDALIVASFGYIAETKLNKEVAEAVKNIAKTGKKICYVMVGFGDYVDDELEDGVVIKTGYTDLEEFNSFIDHSDIIVNLRNPSMGETSGAMLRILQLGKACITNNGGWFSEIPDECVVKIDVLNAKEEVEKAITDLNDKGTKRKEIGERAMKYIEAEFAPEVIANKIKEFITN